MNILFDARIFEYAIRKNAARTGVFFVAINLLKKIAERKDVSVFLYLPQKNNYILNILGGIKIKSILSDEDDFFEINVYFSAYKDKIDKLSMYPKISCYNILYDVIPLLFPQYYSEDERSRFISTYTSDYYFSISDNTAKDFLKYFPNLDKNNIQTIPLSTNFKYKPNNNIDKLKTICKKYSIPEGKKYLFSLCSLELRKNLIRAVKTFIEFIEKNNIDDLVYVLGGQAWDGFIETFEKEVPEYENYRDKIIRGGYIDDEDLEILYSNAEWFVYTSQYEGFGMPPLEAMACGCPVIVSNNSSMPEVVGNSGIMIDYDSDEQHIEAYEKYYFDKQFREEMAQKGLERSKLFSWDKAADIILDKMYQVEEKKNKTPLVTIITATRNLIDNGRKDWFIQNLESVKNQTYKNIEHIVIDGASTDGTIELLREYQDKGWIKYYSEPDEGIYDALNKGIMKANGKYVVCLNSDDFYCENRAVEWLVSKAEETEADACCASTKFIHPHNPKIEIMWSVDTNDYLIFGEMACHQTYLIKTDTMKELGLYSLKYKVSSDTAFMYKMLQNNKKTAKIYPTIVIYRLGGFSSDTEQVYADISNALFEFYGKNHELTLYDTQHLIRNKFLDLPFERALKLGAKLVHCDNEVWIAEYYKRLLSKRPKAVKKNAFIKEIFSIRNEYTLFEKYKVVTIFGIKFKKKVQEGRKE